MDFLDNLRKLKTDVSDLSCYSLDALKFLLLHARNVEQEYNNLQSVVKVDANSLYGSCGNEFFDLGDVDIAEDITTICRHFAILVDIGINTFFTTWANEENLKIIQSFYPHVTELKNFYYRKDTVDDLCVYGDTDSRYLDLEMIYNLLIVDGVSMKLPSLSKEGNKELSTFAIFLNDNFLQRIIKDTIDVDIKYRNANPGYLKMSHETVTRKCVFVGKKCYIKSIIWKDGKFLDNPELEYCGISLQKGESTKELKKILSKLVHKFFIEGLSIDFIQREVTKLKKYFIASDNKRMLMRITTVSGVKNIECVIENGKKVYKSPKNDMNKIGYQLICSWLNFLEDNGLTDQFGGIFEKQKVFYYKTLDPRYPVMGIPDDVDINLIKNLPSMDWNEMIKQQFINNANSLIRFNNLEVVRNINESIGSSNYVMIHNSSYEEPQIISNGYEKNLKFNNCKTLCESCNGVFSDQVKNLFVDDEFEFIHHISLAPQFMQNFACD